MVEELKPRLHEFTVFRARAVSLDGLRWNKKTALKQTGDLR